MAKLNGKTLYAQSSDIKSRTYLEYRRDMKIKAIAELEILPWLEEKLKQQNPQKMIRVYKSGGDKFLWFLRKGGISREPDFIAEINGKKLNFEFQYVNSDIDNFYFNFKISKLIKKGRLLDTQFLCMLSKSPNLYAMIDSNWVLKNSYKTTEKAWGSREVMRIDGEKMRDKFQIDLQLPQVWDNINAKIFILNFAHQLIDINKENLSHLLQSVIDENRIIKIIPQQIDDFFKVCFILDNLNKIPKNTNLWLVYLLSYINKTLNLELISKIVYCLDFLYTKIEIKSEELSLISDKIKELIEIINGFYKNDGSYQSSLNSSPLDETRFALFSVHILEDLIQDLIYYYSVIELNPINKIFQNLKDVKKSFEYIKSTSH